MQQDNNWLPLESNPQVINQYVGKLGLDLTTYNFSDVLSLDDWGLQMVPKNPLGIVFLYPCTPKQKKYQDQLEQKIQPDCPKDLFYMKQEAKNACGTIALIHIAYNQNKVSIKPGSFLAQKKSQWINKKPQQVAKLFTQQKELKQEHKKAVKGGKSEVKQCVDLHFIAFIRFNSQLYQLDGHKKGPLAHGPTTEENFLQNAAKIMKEYMARDPQNPNFAIMALAPIMQQ